MMAPGGGGSTARLGRLASVVVGGTVVVTVAGLAWSLLRVGAIRPTYVREAQFLAGLGILAVWAVRNRRRRPEPVTEAGEDRPQPAEAKSPIARSPEPGGGYRLDASLLWLGLLLLALSLGGELLGGPVG